MLRHTSEGSDALTKQTVARTPQGGSPRSAALPRFAAIAEDPALS
ncbi:MAG: hypothetical protein AVDCRST_MAG90-3372 [uncultured Microvirga sp.]|uniref:Uncharacterized protein n=1 Tax=uncultured Microvirga sp. TaxID=412392 RepID=A0A6J4MPW7_9HYPH|nr:MAG: hypothetical protein AVDCRST_MAG90-3372 [uncultured Microvirga sp.]